MPRPTPIIIPGNTGFGGQFKQSEVDLSGLSNLFIGLLQQKRQEAQMTEGAKALAGFLGVGQPTPETPMQLPGGTTPALAVNAPAPVGETGQAISAPAMKPGWGEKAFQSPLVQQGLLELMKDKFGRTGDKQYTSHIVVPDKTSSTGYRYKIWDIDTGNFNKMGEEAPGPIISKTTPGVSDISGIRKEFEGSQIYKDYVTVKPQAEKMQRAYDMIGKNNVAVDQTIITVLNKMLDPSSVVRESEYARTPENLSLLNRVRGYIGKQGYGGAGLTNEDRKSVLDMAKQFSALTEDYYKEHEQNYKKIADYYGAPHNLIITTPKFKFSSQKATGKPPQRKYQGLSNEELLKQLQGQ